MTPSRTDVSEGLLDELERFEGLVRSLNASQWETPSRCEGWTVGDVARHTIGSMADVAAGRLDGLGSPEVTKREVDERAGRSPAQLADECAEATKAAAGLLPMFDDAAWEAAGPSDFDGTLGRGVEALWYDTWMHAEDIRAALDMPSELTSGFEGARSHVAWDLARLTAWNGSLPADHRDAYAFIMVATGRADASTLGTDAPPNMYA